MKTYRKALFVVVSFSLVVALGFWFTGSGFSSSSETMGDPNNEGSVRSLPLPGTFKSSEFLERKQRPSQGSFRKPFYFANQRFDRKVKKYDAEKAHSETTIETPVAKHTQDSFQLRFHEKQITEENQKTPVKKVSVQEQAKKLLGIDAREVFGVDMDAERHAVQNDMKARTDVRLVNMLNAQGIDTALIEKHMKIRRELKLKAQRQPVGARNYNIETGLEEPVPTRSE